MVFPVDNLATLEAEHGILMERRGTAEQGGHQRLLLEACFDRSVFTAHIMLDAARALLHGNLVHMFIRCYLKGVGRY